MLMHSRSVARYRVTLLVAALLLLPGVAQAQTVAPAGTRHFLWTVQAGDRLVYLAGSVHALTPDMYPLDPVFERAFNASGSLVEEIDLAEADNLAAIPLLMSKGMYLDGRTFDQVVSPETAALVAARLNTIGMPGFSALLGPMKPWVITLILTSLQAQQAGLDPALGLDKYFLTRRPPLASRSSVWKRRRRNSICSTPCRTPFRNRCCAARSATSTRATRN